MAGTSVQEGESKPDIFEIQRKFGADEQGFLAFLEAEVAAGKAELQEKNASIQS